MTEMNTPFIDLEGLADRLLAPREIVRDEYGHLIHPALPIVDEGVRSDLLLAAFGLDMAYVCMETDCEDQAVLDKYFEEGTPDCSGWTPTTPAGDGWVLLEVYDTEDGPYAMFARRKPPALRPTHRQAAAAREAEREAAARAYHEQWRKEWIALGKSEFEVLEWDRVPAASREATLRCAEAALQAARASKGAEQ